ncbi:mitochondrial 18 KDa protein-domain-containing protein [Papiliotrema laurentii]|uniref:Mitochondrial fission process protein 1 n=1 Tax=Papiliotrema laurentii TaxID=5418 RepID=A0AAD9FUH3_PAPLA|nr:mitochondrial 18 KDa protein-domain-containing protein [Papiliotrema laurentii]
MSTSTRPASSSSTSPQAANSVTETAKAEVQDLVREDADSTETNYRYAAYLRRIRDIARAGSRYTAYTSDVGEAFRPVVPPWVVTAAYGVSWAYLIGDVSFTTYKSSQQGPTPFEAAHMTEPTRLGLVTVKRAVFQGVASMALPAFTIHSAVKYAGRQFAKAKSPAMKRWGPTAVGIGIVPFLPYLFDEPVEHAVDFAFDKLEETYFRKDGVNIPRDPKKEL